MNAKTELKILRNLRIEIEKELDRSTDPTYAPSQLENIYNLIIATY